MSHVFVSYSKKDREYVLRLVDKLLEEGFDVWIDKNRLRSSEDWWLSIVEALREAAAFIVVLTPNLEESEWAQLEITLATKYKKARFPILLEGTMDTPKSEIFARTQWVDATDGKLPKAEFYDLLEKYAERKASRGTTLSDTGKLERKVNPFLDDDPILIEAVSSPPLTNEEGEDLDLTPLSVKIPPNPDPRIETVISKAVTISNSHASATPDPKTRMWFMGRRTMIILAALLVVVLAVTAYAITSNQGQIVANAPTSTVTLTPTIVVSTSTATVTASATSEILIATSTPDLSKAAATVPNLNKWLITNGHNGFKESLILSELAQRQRSYLMSLSVPEFNALDSLYRDRDGRDVQEMAKAMGYKGDVQMIVEVASSVIKVGEILEKIQTSADADVYSRFHEIGIDSQSSLMTDPVKVYFVLVIGTGAPS